MDKNTSPEERPEDAASVSDEEWAEFVRRAGNDRPDAPKEPSARARMVTRRLRTLDEEAARARGGGSRWGRGRKPAEPWQPEGWRTGPAWQQMNGRSPKWHRLKSTLGLLALVGLVLVVVRPSLLTDHLPGGEATDRAVPRPTRSAAAGAAADPDLPTRSEPFRGSPALGWADGAEGLELPEAKAVGGLSEKQVGHALRTTREFLVAANLDPATLRGEKPRKALALLDPLQEGMREQLDRSLAEPAEKRDPLTLFSRFDPDEAGPVGDVVKTRGRMTFEAGRAGSVEVHADYTFVYPLRKAGAGPEVVTRTIVRRQLTTVLYDPAKFVATRGKISLLKYEQQAANSACEVYDGFLHPLFPGDVPDVEPTGAAVDPYDRGEWPAGEGCGTITRT